MDLHGPTNSSKVFFFRLCRWLKRGLDKGLCQIAIVSSDQTIWLDIGVTHVSKAEIFVRTTKHIYSSL